MLERPAERPRRPEAEGRRFEKTAMIDVRRVRREAEKEDMGAVAQQREKLGDDSLYYREAQKAVTKEHEALVRDIEAAEDDFFSTHGVRPFEYGGRMENSAWARFKNNFKSAEFKADLKKWQDLTNEADDLANKFGIFNNNPTKAGARALKEMVREKERNAREKAARIDAATIKQVEAERAKSEERNRQAEEIEHRIKDIQRTMIQLSQGLKSGDVPPVESTGQMISDLRRDLETANPTHAADVIKKQKDMGKALDALQSLFEAKKKEFEETTKNEIAKGEEMSKVEGLYQEILEVSKKLEHGKAVASNYIESLAKLLDGIQPKFAESRARKEEADEILNGVWAANAHLHTLRARENSDRQAAMKETMDTAVKTRDQRSRNILGRFENIQGQLEQQITTLKKEGSVAMLSTAEEVLQKAIRMREQWEDDPFMKREKKRMGALNDAITDLGIALDQIQRGKKKVLETAEKQKREQAMEEELEKASKEIITRSRVQREAAARKAAEEKALADRKAAEAKEAAERWAAIDREQELEMADKKDALGGRNRDMKILLDGMTAQMKRGFNAKTLQRWEGEVEAFRKRILNPAKDPLYKKLRAQIEQAQIQMDKKMAA